METGGTDRSGIHSQLPSGHHAYQTAAVTHESLTPSADDRPIAIAHPPPLAPRSRAIG
jgi:hypothetical protein